jgi:hypothetical protein
LRAAIAGIRFENRVTRSCRPDIAMLRWLIVVFLALVIFAGLRPWLEKIGLGKLPGDFRFRLGGREWFIPLTSSVLLAFIAMVVGKFL